ncbi:endonuclease-reverse transcriptase [Plakobranchus ocellatus]|uniref:Endonuclease-reverse transcriptase n=1 Tax=Plakobranchus ocellatus TaxID=259542 RepID=A0AAV4C8V7_9GAST|nr:endonuclease-reverse transcriptase [Plakobranchus ocellatus]
MDPTTRVTEWQPRNGKRSRGRQARRWREDIVKTKGKTWSRDARDRDEWRRDAEGYILQLREKCGAKNNYCRAPSQSAITSLLGIELRRRWCVFLPTSHLMSIVIHSVAP